MAGADSLCAIPGSGQISQPVDLAQAVSCDPSLEDQSDAQEDVIMDRHSATGDTCLGTHVDLRGVGLSSSVTETVISGLAEPSGQAQSRSKRGLAGPEKCWVSGALEARYGDATRL